jgi:hypothetical protein
MPSITQQLKEIQERIGNVGTDKLHAAARKKKVPGVTRDAVRLFLSTDASKQLFRPLPESKGKTGAEAQQFRIQMDLIDMKYSPSKVTARGPSNKNAIILIDVMSRFAWGAPCVSKEPSDVEPVLRRLLNSMDKRPVFISSDRGNEFTGAVAKLLEDKGIIHRTKSDTHDMNSLSVVDRLIQTIKKRLAESLAAKKGEWAARLPVVIRQYNATEHPAIHGEPDDFGKAGHEVSEFITQAENADKLKHNTEVLEKRKKKLTEEGGFRVPVGGPKAFHRGFKQAYSGQVFELQKIEGSIAIAKDGKRTDLKRAMPVRSASGDAEAGFALSDGRIQNKKDKLVEPLMLELYTWLSPGEQISLSGAASHLKEQLGAERYKEILKSVGFQHLVQAVRLFEHEFTVDRKGYYMKRN